MTRDEFRQYVRFMFADTDNANTIYREALTTQPRNIIDGTNKVFFLLNRRLVGVTQIYDRDGIVEDPLGYTVTSVSGKIEFVTPPRVPLFADYAWRKLTDAEMDQAIDIAAASGNFDPANVSPTSLDFCAKYAAAYCYQFATSKASEYYTLSAGGKQVSKSELFNHFYQMYEKLLGQAQQLRQDLKTDRGDRDVPGDGESFPDWVRPYFPSDGGL